MLYRIAIFFATVFAMIASGNAQESNIREIQYTEYLLVNDFNGLRVEETCRPNDGVIVTFEPVADEPNLDPYLAFLKLRPDRLRYFNGGQFSQVATALGYGVEAVCEAMIGASEANAEDAPKVDLDPVVDIVNLSDFRFEYHFQHEQPEGYLPLARRVFSVVELDAEYNDDTFPDENNKFWVYQSTELIITVNDYAFFDKSDTRDPATLNRADGSLPCYYKHPTLRAVYRHAWEDCNPDTYIEDAPEGVSLFEAVEALTVDFIEQNIDPAAPRKSAPDEEPTEVCCRERGRFFGLTHSFKPLGECRDHSDKRFSHASARHCKRNEPDPPPPHETPRRGEPPRGGESPRGGDRDVVICCEDYTLYTGPKFNWMRRDVCLRQDRHREARPRQCIEQGPRQICCHDYRGINPNDPSNYFPEDENLCRDLDGHEVLPLSACR